MDLLDQNYFCKKCGHHQEDHQVKLSGDVITSVTCRKCPPHVMLGWKAVHQVKHHERLIEITDRKLVEVRANSSCWGLSDPGAQEIRWSPSLNWQVCMSNSDIRELTDDAIKPRKVKPALGQLQESTCCGCQHVLPLHKLEIDHIVPKSRGGKDQADNIQLLCSTCNRIKGNRDMDFLRKRVVERGDLRPDIPRQSSLSD